MENQQAQPEFWNDSDHAQSVVKEIQTLKNWTEAYEEAEASISDLETLHEFYQAGEADEAEIAAELSLIHI